MGQFHELAKFIQPPCIGIIIGQLRCQLSILPDQFWGFIEYGEKGSPFFNGIAFLDVYLLDDAIDRGEYLVLVFALDYAWGVDRFRDVFSLRMGGFNFLFTRDGDQQEYRDERENYSHVRISKNKLFGCPKIRVFNRFYSRIKKSSRP